MQNKPYILYAGAFSHNKNQRRLIAAWDILRRQDETFPSLVLIGPWPAEFMQKVIQPAVAATAHPEEILIPGFVSDGDIGWAYRHAHAYVQPSFAEGFGMPVVQGMSCGIPVACSNSTSLPEVAGGAALLFEPDDVEDIAATLLPLVFNEGERDRLQRLGRERA